MSSSPRALGTNGVIAAGLMGLGVAPVSLASQPGSPDRDARPSGLRRRHSSVCRATANPLSAP